MLCAQHHGGPCSVALRTPTHPFCTASAPGAKRRRLAVLCVSALPQGSPQNGKGLRTSTAVHAAQTLDRTTEQLHHYQQVEAAQEGAILSWTKQWYPMAAVEDLDPAKPHAVKLLGRDLVLWRDAGQQWRAFEDLCPHRKVPLSEGRIEGSDGSLMCGYHGWRFDGTGRCTAIPQLASVDKRAEVNACTSTRSCATAFPTQVRQGLLWVWGESGSGAQQESAQRQPAVNPLVESVPEGQFTYSYKNYVRDMPGSFDVWVENSTDQSHVAFAHSTIAGKRGGEKEGYFKMTRVAAEPDAPPQAGFSFAFDWTSNGAAINKNTTFTFVPPCYYGFQVDDKPFNLWIYAVPTTASSTRLIICAGGDFQTLLKNTPLKALLSLKRFLPRAAPHLQLNAVNDGDIVFMHRQSSHNAATGRQACTDGAVDWSRHYFTPADSDRGVMVWRKWLSTKGGGGPRYVTEAPAEPWHNAVGHLRREELLDRFHQHTEICASCSKGLEAVRAAQMGVKVTLGALFLTAAVVLGSGSSLNSTPFLASAAAFGTGCVALQALAKLEAQFVFTDWSQHDLN